MQKIRIIIDTNVLVSRAIKAGPTITRVVSLTEQIGQLLTSQEVFDELRNVMMRFVNKRYVSLEEAAILLADYSDAAQWIPILERITLCRDPQDNKFLALAANGKADVLVTGDDDLLMHHPFRGTQILSPLDFIKTFEIAI